mgnify:CR=1 FL=1
MSVEKQGGNKKYFSQFIAFVSTVLTQMRIIIILNMCVK